jgi:hypothetical protein
MLDSKNMDSYSMRILRETPLDAEAKSAVDELKFIPLQTKVDIYDAKCAGCGFSLQLVIKDNKVIGRYENDIQGAIEQVCDSTALCHIERSCAYPSNCIESDKGLITPSLTEIIMNTCRFWDPKKLETHEEENTEILSYGQISKYGCDREIHAGSLIPERESPSEVSS